MEPMVYIKIHEERGERIVAICDEELLDKKLVDAKLGIVFHVNREFYGGSLVPLSMAIEEAKNATILNIVGEKIVSAAIRNELIHPDAVIRIAGVPHAQAIRMIW
ncbi:MAG: DUF424 family protein [Pyrodictiaceae archaeon]